jgi:hypothetical protein
MHSHLVEVLARLDDSRLVLRGAVDGVPEARRRLRPSADRWSVAEVLEHLAKVDHLFAERIAVAIRKAQAAGLASEQSARQPLSPEIVKRMHDRTERRTARDDGMPTGAVDSDTAWGDLDRAREEVRSAIVAADGLALGDVTAEHRFFGPLTVYQWVELTAAHEIRHADQIREIGAALQ